MPSEAAPATGLYTLITGAGSGIGAALALRLASAGSKVILVGRRVEPLQGLASNLPGQDHLIHATDLTDGTQVALLFSWLKSQAVQLDGLVHCAGVHWLRPIQVMTSDHYQEMLDSHLKSTFHLLKESISQRAFSKTGASVVLLSSAAALQGGAGSFAYASAKGGLIAATRVAAMEFANRKIRVNAILPGVVDTPQSRAFLGKMSPEQQDAIRKDHPLGIGTPEDVAAAVEFLLSSGARWITGTTLVVDGGLTAH
jgi:NAD(P)-dependent dehydrogenase (short-subunit alcohol dehydrogenase family)